MNNKPSFLKSGDTLICFGDSLTAAPNGYVSFLKKKLPEIHIINAGLNGDKTPAALMRYKTDVLDLKPQAISIFLGTNDAAIGRGRWSDEPMVSAEGYYTNLCWMVHLARLASIQNISIATPFFRFEGPAYVDQGNILNEYCLAARKAAATMNTWLIPLDVMSAEEWACTSCHSGLLLTQDGVHPTLQTYEKIADKMIESWN